MTRVILMLAAVRQAKTKKHQIYKKEKKKIHFLLSLGLAPACPVPIS
jgi:hypothetical protein